MNVSGNSGWTISTATPTSFYWIGNSGNWSDVNRWSYSSGWPVAGCLPTSIDDVFFDINSFNLGAQSVTVDIPNAYCRDMTWTGATGAPVLAGPGANNMNIHGSLIFIAAMNLTFAGEIHFSSNITGQTIITAGQIFKDEIYFDGAGGGWTLLDAMNGFSPDYRGIYLDNGTLNTNGQYVKCGKLWGTAYYRISQTDFNGITESFQTQSTNCNESTEIYPNPFVDQLIISAEYNGVLTLLDLTGKVIYRSSFEAGKTTISTQGIATGTYIAHLELVNGNYEDVKLVKF